MLGTALLTIVLFVVGFYVQSFALVRFGEPITAFWFVLSWVAILAWAFISYRIARAIAEWLSSAWARPESQREGVANLGVEADRDV